MASWLKLADDIHSHPKVYAAGPKGLQVFIWALCRNRSGNHDGRIPKAYFEAAYLSRQLQCDVTDVTDGIAASLASQLLSEGKDTFDIVGWDSDEWGLYQSSSAARMRKHRERKRNNTDSVTSPKVTRDAVTLRRGEERRREEDIPKPKSARKTPLPEGWSPSEKHAEIAKDEGRDLGREATKFRETAMAKGYRYVDWNLAFNNWLRNDNYRGTANGTKPASVPSPPSPKLLVDGYRGGKP